MFIEDSDGLRLVSETSMKMLGFHFGPRPSVAYHVDVLQKRFRRRAWILIHLRHAGFNEEELAKVY